MVPFPISFPITHPPPPPQGPGSYPRPQRTQSLPHPALFLPVNQHNLRSPPVSSSPSLLFSQYRPSCRHRGGGDILARQGSEPTRAPRPDFEFPPLTFLTVTVT